MAQVESQTARVSIGFKLFDSEGVDLIRTMENGRESLDKFQREAEALGLAVNRVDAAKIEQANDAMNLAKRALTGIANTIAIELAPIVTALADSFVDARKNVDDVGGAVRSMVDAMVTGVGWVADAWHGWRIIVVGIRGDFAEFQRIVLSGFASIEAAAIGVRNTFESLIPGGTDVEAMRGEIARLTGEIERFGETSPYVQGFAQRIEELQDKIDRLEGPNNLPMFERMTQEASITENLLEAQYTKLVASERPSQAMARNLEEARARAEELARATAEAHENMSGGTEGVSTDANEKAARAAETARAQAEKSLETVLASIRTKEEAEQAAFEKRRAIVEEAVNAEIIERARGDELITQLAQQRETNLLTIAQQAKVAGTELTRAQVAEQIEAYSNETKSRAESERAAFERRREIIEGAVQAEIVSRQQADELIESLAQQHADRLAQIARETIVAGTGLTAERLQAEIQAMTMNHEARIVLEQEQLAQRLELLRAGFEQEFITEQEFRDLSVKAAEDAQERITKITEDGYTERQKFAAKSTAQQAQQVLGSLASMTAGVAQSNRTMFRINKLAAIGNAVVNTAQGVTQALAAYPPPLSFIMAAAQAAAGAAQISAIKATSFGGGTTPSVAGSAATVNGVPVNNEIATLPAFERDTGRDRARVEVYIQGSVIGAAGAEELVDFIQESLSDRVNNRDEIIFNGSSRQASV
jgi:hypothetical protein